MTKNYLAIYKNQQNDKKVKVRSKIKNKLLPVTLSVLIGINSYLVYDKVNNSNNNYSNPTQITSTQEYDINSLEQQIEEQNNVNIPLTFDKQLENLISEHNPNLDKLIQGYKLNNDGFSTEDVTSISNYTLNNMSEVNDDLTNKLVYEGIEKLQTNDTFNQKTALSIYSSVYNTFELNPSLIETLGPNSLNYLENKFIDKYVGIVEDASINGIKNIKNLISDVGNGSKKFLKYILNKGD